jgi:hypothetical protein
VQSIHNLQSLLDEDNEISFGTNDQDASEGTEEVMDVS